MKRTRKSGLLVGAAMLALMFGGSAAAQAATITGSISFGGVWEPVGGTGIADATGVDVVGDAANVNCANLPPGTGSCTGDYAAINGNFIVADYNDFTFAPFSAVTPLWSFTFNGVTYAFDLTSATVTNQTNVNLTLTGMGILYITGFTPTVGSWSFSGDTTGGIFAFSSTNTAKGIPEPASILLLGLGLLTGARAVRRRRAK